MPSSYDKSIAMLTADTEVAATATTSLVSVANVIHCSRDTSASIYLYVSGDAAGSTGKLTFLFQRSPDKVNWHNWFVMEPTGTGEAVVTSVDTTKDIDVSSTNFLRLASVANASVGETSTSKVNAYIKVNH